MQRKTNTVDLDYPKDDIECWDRYPKHHWVYDLSRLLDAQNIKWSPFETESLPNRELNMELVSKHPVLRQPGYIYIHKLEGEHVITEVHLSKGEIKNMRHFDPVTDNEHADLIGEIELRISAFVTLYFQKFTGVISVDTYGVEILKIRLRPHIDPAVESNTDIAKLIKRSYRPSSS